MAGANPRRRQFGRDARGVRHAVRIRRPAAALLPGGGAGHVARPHHHGEVELVAAVFVRQRLDIADGHFDLGAGRDVGHRLGKDVGPLLVEQAGELALRAGLLVNFAGLFATLDYALYHTIGDAQRHVVHGSVVGERKGIDGLNGFGEGIFELLGDVHPRHEAADFRLDAGVLQGAVLAGVLAVRVDQRQLAGGLLVFHGARRMVCMRQAPLGQQNWWPRRRRGWGLRTAGGADAPPGQFHA